MTRNVLIVAAHPDDEILGVGGTAAWHVDRGDRVATAILAEGATSRDKERDVDDRRLELQALRRSAALAAGKLGLPEPDFFGLPDNRMDRLDLLDVVKIVEEIVEKVDPDIVYTHHFGDLNIDHDVTHRAVVTACRPLPEVKPRAIYSFETVSSTEWSSIEQGASFRPQHYVDISAQLDRKLEALAEYPGEMRPFPHARSIEAVECLAKLRGSQIGRSAAEAFMVVRQIEGGLA